MALTSACGPCPCLCRHRTRYTTIPAVAPAATGRMRFTRILIRMGTIPRLLMGFRILIPHTLSAQVSRFQVKVKGCRHRRFRTTLTVHRYSVRDRLVNLRSTTAIPRVDRRRIPFRVTPRRELTISPSRLAATCLSTGPTRPILHRCICKGSRRSCTIIPATILVMPLRTVMARRRNTPLTSLGPRNDGKNRRRLFLDHAMIDCPGLSRLLTLLMVLVLPPRHRPGHTSLHPTSRPDQRVAPTRIPISTTRCSPRLRPRPRPPDPALAPRHQAGTRWPGWRGRQSSSRRSLTHRQGRRL
jgi:hypothetical protein